MLHDSPKTFADKVIDFHLDLRFDEVLPEGFDVLNPFQNHEDVIHTMSLFYRKFYSDHNDRKFIIGINPGRFGAGITGVPFTDTKRLQEICGIEAKAKPTHEVSSVFIYNLIDRYGGVEKFYGDIYINSLFPLAIIQKNKKGNWVNCNYYDDKRLVELIRPLMLSYLYRQLDFGLRRDKAFVLGKKNAEFLHRLNDQEKIFDEIVTLEHPRYIQQYKSKEAHHYIEKFVRALTG